MKIMLITQLPPPSGGIATWSKKYVRYCEENNISLAVVNNAMIGNRGSDFHAKKSLCAELKRAYNVIKDIRKTKNAFHPEVVHFNITCSPTGIIRDYLYICTVGRKIPVLLHCRCTVQDQLHGSKIGIHFFKKTVARANKVLVLNESSAIYTKEITGKTPVKVANFIDEEYIRKDEKVINEKIERVVYNGHVQTAKGCNEILAAAKSFPNVQFRFVGQVDDGFNKETASENVIFLGNQPPENVKQELDEADVFLFPSYTEGFANSVAEAMARGLPIIASDVGANKDMIENNGGIIIPAKNDTAIIEAIKRIENPELRKQMSKWNLKKVADKYIIQKVMDELFTLYSDSM